MHVYQAAEPTILCWGNFYISLSPSQFLVHIKEVELLTIMVAVKVWGHQLRGECFEVLYENTVAVAAMNMARMHSSFAQACMREIAY